MNIIVWMAVFAAITVPLFIWWDSRRRRGTKIMIKWSKFIDDREIIWNPHKTYFGFNRYNKSLNVEEFKLPSVMGGETIEGLNPDDLEVTNRNYPTVHLVQIGERTFIPKRREDTLISWEEKHKDVDKTVIKDEKHVRDTGIPVKKFFTTSRLYLADKDVNGWAQMQMKYNNQVHADKKKGWDKYSALIIPAVAIIAAVVIIVFAIQNANEITADASGEIRDSTNKISGLVQNFINNQNSNSDNQPTDAARPPAAQQDSGGGNS